MLNAGDRMGESKPRWTLRRVPGGSDDAPPMSELIDQGQPTGVVLPGAVLEAAVALDQSVSGHLLFLTDDIPYEEALRIILLGPRFELLDQAEIGGAYTTGSFSGLSLSPPDTLRFRFMGDADWSVRVLPRPALYVPCLSESRGVSRPWGWRRHFVVQGRPRPEPISR
jgi:hypothetical protein